MIDQVRAVLDTYRTRGAFQAYAVAMAPILLFTFFLFSKPPGGHPQLAYLVLVAPAAAIFFAILGEQMKMQFTSWRSKLGPDYVLPHLTAAFVLTSIAGLLLFAMSLGFYLAIPPHVSIATLAALWTLCLVTFSAGYFFVPQVVYLLLMVTMLNGTLIRWVEGMDEWTSVAVAAADLVLTLALVKRMLSATEEEFEFRSKDRPEEAQRRMWRRLSKRTWTNRITLRREHILDRPCPPARDAISQIRHFAATISTSQYSLLSMTAMLIAMFWAGRLIMDSADFAADPMMLVVLPAIMLFMQMERDGGVSLQSTFMLPLRREQIVSRYGAALLIVLLKGWFMFAAALFVVDWLPVPGKTHAVPAMTPFLISLAAQAPMFGALMLIIGRYRMMMPIIGLVIFATLLVMPFGQWSLLASAIAGPALILFSYRRWCRAEII